jgi:hypothetical protein
MKAGIKSIIFIVDNVKSAIHTTGAPMKAHDSMPETHVVAAHGWVLIKLPKHNNECVLQKTSVTFINGEATRKPLIDELMRRSSEGEYSVLYLSHVFSNSESSLPNAHTTPLISYGTIQFTTITSEPSIHLSIHSFQYSSLCRILPTHGSHPSRRPFRTHLRPRRHP